MLRRIDPADVAVAAPIDDVDAAVDGVAEDHDRRIGEVHRHDRVADRHGGKAGRLLGDDHRIVVDGDLDVLVAARR